MSRAGVLATCILCSCGADQPEEASIHFTVRGRWEDPSHLSYRIEREGSPVAEDIWTSAAARALSAWGGTGVVAFQKAEADRDPDVTLAWRREAHGECEPFGISSAVAHSGPVEPGTFVHLDADRNWDEKSLYRTLLHEAGHVLGLGHSADPGSLLTPEGGGERITESELAGLHSLYGGGTAADGDVGITSGEGTALVLRRIAPPGITDLALFDTDGDGNDELLVWRTDPVGHGALMVYQFSAGPRLTQTTGPLHGVAAPGVPIHPVSFRGRRLLVSVQPNGALQVLEFQDAGLLPVPEPEGLKSGMEGKPYRLTGDLDGDGVLETVVPSGRA